MKALALGFLIALPCFVSAGIFDDLQRTQCGKVGEINAVTPTPVIGIVRVDAADADKASNNKLYDASTPFLYAPNIPFSKNAYTYDGCIADESKALAELDNIVTGLKEAKFPVLQSDVNKKADCIDYTVRYTSNLDLNKFTYSGWLPDLSAAKAEMQAAVNSLKKAGIPLILQASVNEKKEGIDYTVNFLANAGLEKHEYVGYFSTPAEAVKAMADTVSSLNASKTPVLQATVRTSKEGSDYLIWYVVLKAISPTVVTPVINNNNNSSGNGTCTAYGCSSCGTCTAYGCPKCTSGYSGGTCNAYGCSDGGTCTAYGCSSCGTCTAYGCPTCN